MRLAHQRSGDASAEGYRQTTFVVERRAVTAMKEFLHEKEQALLVLIRLVEGETVAAVIHFQSCQFLSVSQCLRRPGLPGSYYLVTRLDH